MLPSSAASKTVFALAIGFACAGLGCSSDGAIEDSSATNEAAVAAGSYGATYVSQSFPLATTTLKMTAGQVIPSNIVLKNSGSASWDSNTRLGTTEARDRVSVFADSTWVNASRPSAVTGSVAPGATFKFTFDLKAPATPGTYDEFFGMVEDGAVWFSDSGQLGPPDNDIEVKIEVSAAPPVPDAGTTTDDDAGTEDDGGPISVGQIPEGADGGDGLGHDPTSGDPSSDSGSNGKSGGCSMTPDRKSSEKSAGFAIALALGIAAVARRRRQKV